MTTRDFSVIFHTFLQRKKKTKSDDATTTAPAQPVKKSKAPLTFDLMALMPKKNMAPIHAKKRQPVKKAVPEPTTSGKSSAQ